MCPSLTTFRSGIMKFVGDALASVAATEGRPVPLIG